MVGNSNESIVAEKRGRETTPTNKNKKRDQSKARKSASLEPMVAEFGERLERVQHDFKTLEDHVLEQVNTLKGNAEETNNEVETRFIWLEDMIQAVCKSIEGMREDLTLCKRATVSGGANNVSTPRVECPKPQGFNGARDAKEVENYLWQMEQYFKGIGLNDEAAKVKTAALYLSDIAMLWWRRKHADIERGACRLDTWDEFKKELKKHFYPENVVCEARKKLRELKQRGIMRDYVKEFTALMLQIPNMSEEDLLFYFIDGLQGWGKQEMHRRDIRTIDEAITESLVDFQPYSHTNTTKNKDKYPARGGGERRENNQEPHPMSRCPKLGSLSVIVDRQDTESQAEMGSLQVLNALKAKSLTPTPSNEQMYVEAVINEKLTRAMVTAFPMPSFSSVCMLEKGSPCMIPIVEAPKEQGRDATQLLAIQLGKGIKKGDITYLVMLKEDDENEKMDDLPLIIREVLEKNKDVMLPELPNKLPPRRKVDHKIEQLKELVDMGMIQPSKAPYDTPVLFQKKLDGSLRILGGAKVYTKMDLQKGYYQFMVVYLDDIVVYSNSMEEHIDHLRIVFKILRENELYVKKEKCTFATDEAFEDLKAAVSQEPVLALPDFTMPFEVHTDASDFAIGGILMQEGHPIAFESRKLNDTERRYTVQENEMTTIIHCLRVWRHYLLGAHFTIKTDNVATSYFQTQKKLSPKQARWQDFLAEFDYTLEYKPGKPNVVVDALSRKTELVAISLAKGTVLERIKEGLEQDPLTRELVKLASDGKTQRFGRDLIKECHDTKWAGHPDQKRTMSLLDTTYFWPHMKDSVELYVKTCLVCQQDKVENRQPAGLLEPLPVPQRSWDSITLDFISALPKSEGYDLIMVVVDRFSKYWTFIPCPKDCTAEAAARAFFKNVVKHWGLPRSIISDRDLLFTGHLYTELFKLLGTELNFSTSFHPQTDRQTERVNALLECYLRYFVSANQRDWANLLDVAQFSYNLQRSEATGRSPFELATGQQPLTPHTLTMPLDEGKSPGATKMAKSWEGDAGITRACLEKARKKMKKWADEKKRHRVFSVGDLVIVKLLPQQFKALRSVHKGLIQRYEGPFQVLAKVGKVSYRLDLPSTLKIHPVFHEIMENSRESLPTVGSSQSPPSIEEVTSLREVDLAIARGENELRPHEAY
ncbi:hypothetical protein F3Y22_tig00112344pilonHSYRG00099 [Hibiscus syriacus]|uniref:Integrase catalytic domain-containing protein n=1 Tax=Hibiscus syriacus TaxID=106335 RepID=A0A6A2X128_HIBSY|nr:hypothetical protein F3Y22_tig00112344pilonHSYRG00099 [Hibiscus syriacus]